MMVAAPRVHLMLIPRDRGDNFDTFPKLKTKEKTTHASFRLKSEAAMRQLGVLQARQEFLYRLV